MYEMPLRGVVSLPHCPTTSILADILTKALRRISFQKFVELLGLAVATSGKSIMGGKRGRGKNDGRRLVVVDGKRI